MKTRRRDQSPMRRRRSGRTARRRSCGCTAAAAGVTRRARSALDPADRRAGRRRRRRADRAGARRTSRPCCAAPGFTLADVVKTTVFLADMDDFDGDERGLRAAVRGRPARRARTIAAAGLPKGARVEIEVIAARPRALKRRVARCGNEWDLVVPEDFKSFCRSRIASEVGSIPTRSRHSWIASALAVLLATSRPSPRAWAQAAPAAAHAARVDTAAAHACRRRRAVQAATAPAAVGDAAAARRRHHGALGARARVGAGARTGAWIKAGLVAGGEGCGGRALPQGRGAT